MVDDTDAGTPEPPTKLDPSFEVYTDPGFEGFVFVHHRLFPEDSRPFWRGDEARWNAELDRRKERLRRHEDAGEFEQALRMHHHDSWAEMLLGYKDRFEPGTYWRLVGELYSLYLTPRAFGDEWMQIFSASRTGHEQLMTKEELDASIDLPFLIEAMRGFAHDGGEVGFSWTRSWAVAEHFALEAATYPGAKTPRIAYGSVAKPKLRLKTVAFALILGVLRCWQAVWLLAT